MGDNHKTVAVASRGLYSDSDGSPDVEVRSVQSGRDEFLRAHTPMTESMT